jgi:hypothetical protein
MPEGPLRQEFTMMRKPMNRTRISVIASIVGAVAAIHAASTRPAYTQSKPDLVVLIAVDQFSASLEADALGDRQPGRVDPPPARIAMRPARIRLTPVIVGGLRVSKTLERGPGLFHCGENLLPPPSRRIQHIDRQR